MYAFNDITPQKSNKTTLSSSSMTVSSASWHPIHMTASEDLWELPTLPSRSLNTSMDEQDSHQGENDHLIPFSLSSSSRGSLSSSTRTPERSTNNEDQRKKRRTLEDASNTAPIMGTRQSMF